MVRVLATEGRSPPANEYYGLAETEREVMNTEKYERLRMVTSRQNQLVKDMRRAFAHAELTDDGFCAVEGLHIVEEAIRSGLKIKALLFAESAQERANRLLPQVSSQTETLVLPDEVFRSAVTTETPQGVAALVKLKDSGVEDMLRGDETLIMGAAGVQDPGNLGTIVRSAEAFGASGVLALPGTVSPLNSKVVRGASGSVFRLPVVKTGFENALAVLKGADVTIAATSSHKGAPLHEVDLTGPVCIFVGSEGAGVPREVLAEATQMIAIPHSPRVESLNAGIAASIILYEAARQRGHAAESS